MIWLSENETRQILERRNSDFGSDWTAIGTGFSRSGSAIWQFADVLGVAQSNISFGGQRPHSFASMQSQGIRGPRLFFWPVKRGGACYSNKYILFFL